MNLEKDTVTREKECFRNNSLGLAIFATLCCCLPLGIWSIVLSSQANTEHARGDYDRAYELMEKSKKISIISIILGVVVTGLYLLLGIIGGSL